MLRCVHVRGQFHLGQQLLAASQYGAAVVLQQLAVPPLRWHVVPEGQYWPA